MMIGIYERELLPISVYDTFEEAQAAMKADCMACVDPDEFKEMCEKNDGPCCDYWGLRDDNAWMGDHDDWYIVPVPEQK